MTDNPRTIRARHVAAAFCGGAAVLIALLAVWLGLGPRGQDVAVLGKTGDPSETVARFFHALCLHEWEDAASHVRGEPDLDLGRMPENPVERQIWETYLLSWSWSMGEGGMTDSVSAWQEVHFTAMRPDVFTDALNDHVETVLSGWVNERPLAEVYDENGQFREEVVRAALEEAVRDRLARSDEYLAVTTVTLHLIYENGQWLILPEDALWNALSGIPEGGSV